MVRIYQTAVDIIFILQAALLLLPRLCFPHRSREKQVIQVAKLFFPQILQARNDNKMLFSFGWSYKDRGPGSRVYHKVKEV